MATLGVAFFAIRSGKLRRYWSWRNVADVWWIIVGICQAVALIRRLRPSIVFSKGGYVAFPVVVGAWFWRVPIVAHESDLTPGLANRLSLPFVDAVCTNFSSTTFELRDRPVIHTGTPLRADLLHGDAARGRALVGAPPETPLVLVVGGSLGAEALNRVVRAALDSLLRFGVVVHVCGAGRTDAAITTRRLSPVRIRRRRLGRSARGGRRRRQSCGRELGVRTRRVAQAAPAGAVAAQRQPWRSDQQRRVRAIARLESCRCGSGSRRRAPRCRGPCDLRRSPAHRAGARRSAARRWHGGGGRCPRTFCEARLSNTDQDDRPGTGTKAAITTAYAIARTSMLG